MKNLTIILLLTFSAFISSCSNAQTDNVTAIETVSVAEFEKLMNENDYQLVDVRTPGEYQQGNIKGSKLIDVRAASFTSQIETLDKETPVMVYCRSGKRSMTAANILESKGFKTIYNLNGGFNAWSTKH